MQDAASVLTDRFAEVLARLPADLDLDDLAMESKAIQRRREVVDGAALLRIALARGPGGLSLRQTAAWASMQGIAELSNPGVKYRLDQATEFLAALVERLLAAKLPGPELRWPGRTLRLADGTCVSKPGSIGTDWRVHGVFDLGRGGFSNLELTDQHGAEALERGAPHPGEIRIGDRNYARASVLQRFRAQSGGSADFIVRLGWNALQLTNPAGKPFDLIGYLQCLPTDQSPHEVNLRASLGRDEPALAVRLVVQRKTQEAAEATRSALSPHRGQKGQGARPAQPDCSGLHDPGDIAAQEGIQRQGGSRGLPAAVANRACLQTAEIFAAHRPAPNLDRARIAKLALRPPHPCPVV